MINKYLTQEWVKQVTESTKDEPSVIGCGGQQQAWKDAYIARMIKHGFDPESARQLSEASVNDYSTDPRDAADDEIEYWENDGDLA